MNRIAVTVLATDPVTREGVRTLISAHSRLMAVGADSQVRPDVLLVLAHAVTDDVLAMLAAAHRQLGTTAPVPAVLVADGVAQRQLLRAVELGLASLLIRQESDFARIADAIVAVEAGRARLPETHVRTLLDQMCAVGQEMVARCGTGLAVREIEVLRLLSDGMDTREVATKLHYSERTVKNIVHGVLDRFQLRNRTHAVAFALRLGVL